MNLKIGLGRLVLMITFAVIALPMIVVWTISLPFAFAFWLAGADDKTMDKIMLNPVLEFLSELPVNAESRIRRGKW